MGVLDGIRVVEFEAIGPAPFAAILLADMGADVLRIDRPVAPDDLGPKRTGKYVDLTGRGRRSVTLDLKRPEAADATLELMSRADAIIEGFRPGTLERLGLGPDVALARNPKLVYGGMTGWGQTGPLAQRAGHGLNYIALSGVLSGIGRAAAESGRRLRRAAACCWRWVSWLRCVMRCAVVKARWSMLR
jgi:alpha-methylacyl-CoA racemase